MRSTGPLPIGQPATTTSVVSHDEQITEVHADLALTAGGMVVCINRECELHDPVDFANLVFRISRDGGRTWGERRVLVESRGGKDRDFDCVHCPRISRLSDERLVIICDFMHGHETPTSKDKSVSRLWWSEDDGETWTGPQATPIMGIIPSKIIDTPGGALITATGGLGGEKENYIATWRSEDRGQTWQGPYRIVTSGDHHKLPHGVLCGSGSIVALADSTLICYMSNNAPPAPGVKCISRDDGRTWDGPYSTIIPALRGRASAGLLDSGNVLVTYRHNQCDNYFAYTEGPVSALCIDPAKQRGQLFAVAHQPSSHRGAGYDDWIQLPDGEILHVGSLSRFGPKYCLEAHHFSETEI